MTGKDRMAYISIYKKKKRINVYFYTKNEIFFRFVLLWTAGSWHVDVFFKILKKKKKALLHIRTSAFYPSHPQIIPTVFLRSLPV